MKISAGSGLAISFLITLSALAAPTPQKVQVPDRLRKSLKSFEPSAAVYLQDLKSFLISSDDTDKKETPYLFLINDQGQVEELPLLLQGVSRMTDIESISSDEQGFLYLLSSASLNKKGKNKLSRNILVKAERQGRSLKALQVVELRSVLIDAILDSSLSSLEPLKKDIASNLDIEAHFIEKGEIYIGLKNPQPAAGKALILNLGSIDILFSESRLEKLEIWREIDFSAVTPQDALLSDMQKFGDELILSTTSDQGQPGRLWNLNLNTSELKILAAFDGLKPEGLALRDNQRDLFIVFDEGSGESLFIPSLKF